MAAGAMGATLPRSWFSLSDGADRRALPLARAGPGSIDSRRSAGLGKKEVRRPAPVPHDFGCGSIEPRRAPGAGSETARRDLLPLAAAGLGSRLIAPGTAKRDGGRGCGLEASVAPSKGCGGSDGDSASVSSPG